MFMECQFPLNISYGATGGAGWSTRIEPNEGGFEMRSPRFQETSSAQALVLPLQRGRWMVAHQLRTPAEWAALIAFHRLAQGRLNGFRFQDWSDFQATAGQGVLVINAAGHAQLAKQYQMTDYITGQPATVNRIIYKPQPASGDYAGVVFDPAGPSVNYTNGVVTGGAAGVTTWTGQFDLPVRFDADHCELHYRDYNIVDWPGIAIVEIPIQDS
jgi:uncharacterized protein (TIGR02217 family)